MGAKIATAVTKKVDILIAGDEAGGKLQKAEALGITVWDEDKLNQVLNEFDRPAGDEPDDNAPAAYVV